MLCRTAAERAEGGFGPGRANALNRTGMGNGMKKLRIQQVRSAIGRKQDQRKTLEALGITRMGQTVEHNATPQILGMINKISHLVSVSEI